MKKVSGILIGIAFPILAYAQPAAPSGFAASTLSTTSALLSWSDNSTNETGFQVERSTSATTGFVLVATTAANAISYINTGLTSGTQYYYRIRATNAAGQSAYTTASATTTGLRRFLLDFGAPKTLAGWNVIGAPTTGSVTNLNDVTGASSSLSLTIVKDPSNGYGAYSSNGAPQVVLDYPQTAASDGHYGWQTGGSYRLNGLDNTKVYSIRIFSSRMYVGDARKGVFTINGQSLTIDATNNTTQTIQFVNIPPTAGVININFTLASGVAFAYINVMDIVEGSVVPPTPAPSKPGTFEVQATSPTQVQLTWTDVDTETSFQLERSTGSSFSTIATVAANTIAYTDNSVIENTHYYYRISAVNAGGSSDYATGDVTTPISVPLAPKSLVATAKSSKRIDISWADVTNESSFDIQRDETTIATLSANTTTFSDTTLSPNTTYTYRVNANNSAGTSPYSNVVSATTFNVPPVAPSNLAATAVSSKQIDLAWDDVENETGFQIQRNGSIITTVASNVLTYSDITLSPGTTYTYRVSAINSGGSSAYSDAAVATTLEAPPVAPTNLVATAKSAKQIDLSWNDVSNESTFEIEQNGITIATVPSNITTYSDTTLTPNTTYSYRIRAINAMGSSPYSNDASATTFSLVPAAPTGLIATSLSPTQVSLSWTDASQNETGFTIERSTTAGGNFIVVGSVDTNIKTYTDNNLTASTQYFYRVQAFNVYGVSAYTSQASVTTQSLTQPYGTIFSEADFSSASRFPIVGTGITRGTNKLTMAGNPTLFASYVVHDDAASPFRYTCLENWKMRARVKTPSTLNTSSYGIGLGVRSTNTVDPYSTSMRWSWDSGQNFIYLYYKTSISMQMVSTTKYVPQANTYYWVEVTRVKDSFTYKIFDGATGTTQLFSATLTFPTFTAGNYIKAHNTGQFVLYQFGGGNEVTNWEVSTTALKNADYAAIGDSNMHGMFATNNSQRWVENAMTTAGKSFNIFAGISDRASDVLQRVPEVIALKPKNVILSIGRNDLANGVALSTVQSTITNIINTLEAAGITVKLAGVIASNTNVSSLQNFYNTKPNQQVNAYAATKAASSTSLNTAYGSGDLIHLNAAGNTLLSNLLQTILGPVIPPTPTIPADPTGLSATAISASQINLAWTDASNNETAFVVERSVTSGAGFASIATLGTNVTSYSDVGLTNGTKYYYRVKATNAVGSSAYTNEASATTSANAADPTALNASTLSTSSIVLSWTDNSTNETGFQIERSLSSSTGFALAGTVGANITSFMNTGLASGTQYFYRVRATNAGGTSAYSAVTSATTGVKRYLLDFGSPTVQTTATGWNNISAPTTGSVTSLIDATGAASPVTFTIVKDPSNGYALNNTNGPTTTVLDYPSSAVSDSHFGWQSGGSYRINGLDNSKVYHIRIFSSRLYVSDARRGTFTINGQSLSLDAAGNTSQTIQFTNLAPISGAVTINFTVASGSSFAYINVMDIVEATPAGSARKAADESIVVDNTEKINSSFELHPNPVRSDLTIRVNDAESQTATMQLFDLTGREIHRADGETNKDHVLDVRALARGMYLVRIKTGQKIYSKSFLRQD